jgi:hypothetical protein
MFYVPVPVVGIYVKGGLARLKSTASVACPLCLFPLGLSPLSRANVSWAAGAGAQYKLGSLRAIPGSASLAGSGRTRAGISLRAAIWSFGALTVSMAISSPPRR